MKNIDILLLLTFCLTTTLLLTPACGRYGRLFFKQDNIKQQTILKEDKNARLGAQDEIIIQ